MVFLAYGPFGGAFHCSTLDTRRVRAQGLFLKVMIPRSPGPAHDAYRITAPDFPAASPSDKKGSGDDRRMLARAIMSSPRRSAKAAARLFTLVIAKPFTVAES